MSTIKSSTTTTTAYSVEADTTGALIIQTGTTPTTALTISSAQVVSLAQVLPEASGGTGTNTGYYGFKNKVINGAMQINQRNFSGNPASNQTYTLDRWAYNSNQASGITIAQSTDAPSGFYNSMLVTSTAVTTIGVNDFVNLQYVHEAQNLYDFAWQSSSPKAITLSFWVKSSLTGTFGGSLRNNGTGGYSGYPFSYSIPTANTWTFITIPVPAAVVTNGWGSTNGSSMYMYFDFGTGTTYTNTAGAWVAQNVVGASGTTKLVNTNGATWQLTGVQLEKGSTATSFDYRPYGTELLLCQRYFQILEHLSMLGGRTSTALETSIMFPVWMRAVPTINTASSQVYQVYDAFGSPFVQSSVNVGFSVNGATTKGAFIFFENFTGLTQGRTYVTNAGNTGKLGLTAEL